MSQYDLTVLASTVIIYAVTELAVGSIKKSPFWVLRQLFDPVLRFSSELSYLYQFTKVPAFKKASQQYVTLQAIKARPVNSTGSSRPLLDLLNEGIGRGKQVVVLGEPGSGKTTSLEALSYRLANQAYRTQLMVWLLILLIVLLLIIFISPWLVFLLFGLRILDFVFCYWPVPVFIELRHYENGSVEDFLRKAVAERVGGRLISSNLRTYIEHNRLVWLLDGMNEVKGGSSAENMEHWREIFKRGHYFSQSSVILTSRASENPSGRLTIENVLRVVDLNDDGVLEFLRAYGSKNVVEDLRALEHIHMLEEHGLGRNPYWLKMMVESDLYTRNRGALFENFTRQLLQRELDKGVRTFSVDIEMEALGYLAYVMSDAGQVGLALEQAESELGKWLRHKGLDWDPLEILDDVDAATLVRISNWENHIEFSHELVQEFYTTYALRLHLSEAIRWIDNPKRWRTLLMLGGLLEEHAIEGGSIVGSRELFRRFVQLVMGDGKDVTRLLLAMGLLWSVDNQDKQVEHRVISMLINNLSEADFHINEQEILELHRIIGEDIITLFGDILETNEFVSNSKIIDTLSILRSKTAAIILIKHLNNSKHKEHAINALVCMKETAVEPLIYALRDSNNSIQQEIVSILAQIGSPAIMPLIDAFRSPESSVRQAAVAVLVQIGGQAVIPLTEALVRPETSVRQAAVVALGRIGDIRGLEALTLALGDEYNLVRWAATAALKQNGVSPEELSATTLRGVIAPKIELPLDDQERILYYVRRHWVLLVSRVALPFLLATMLFGLAFYRAIGGVFFAINSWAPGKRLDATTVIFLILIITTVFWWIRDIRKPKRKTIDRLFLDSVVIFGIFVLGLVTYFHYQGGRIFSIDPTYTRGGDIFNIGLLLVGVAALSACFYIVSDWANDFLILTNKRLIYDDTQLLVRHIDMRILLENIQEVYIVPTDIFEIGLSLGNLLDSWLDTGKLVVQPYRSFGPRYLVFSFAANARIMRQKILDAVREATAQQQNEVLLRLMNNQEFSVSPQPLRPAIYVSQRLFLENLDSSLGKPNPDFDYEREVVTWRIYWRYLSLILLFPFASCIFSYIVLITLKLNGFNASLMSFIILLIVSAWSYRHYSKYKDDTYTLSRESVHVIRNSRTSQRKHYRIPINSIDDVKCSFNYFERRINCGNVIIRTSDTDMIFYHVPDPRGIQMMINDYRAALLPRDNDKV